MKGDIAFNNLYYMSCSICKPPPLSLLSFFLSLSLSHALFLYLILSSLSLYFSLLSLLAVSHTHSLARSLQQPHTYPIYSDDNKVVSFMADQLLHSYDIGTFSFQGVSSTKSHYQISNQCLDIAAVS